MSGLEDVTAQNEWVSSSQADAVQNIKGADLYQTTPETFKDNRDEWLPEVKNMSLPPMVSRTVATEMKQSPEHTAAIGPDGQELSQAEKIWEDIGNKISNKIGPEQQMNELYLKKMENDGKLEENDDFKLESLKQQAGNHYGQKNLGLTGWWENLPGDVASGVVDMGVLANRHRTIIGSIMGTATAAGALGGAIVGAPGGPLPAAAGALLVGGAAAVTSAIPAYTVAAFYDGYQHMSGATYGALEDIKNTDGAPVDENTKKWVSKGVGAVGGIIQGVADKALLSRLPFIKNFLNPKLMVDILQTPANAAFKTSLVAIGKAMGSATTSAALMGGAASLQEITSILGEEIGNSYHNGQTSLMDAINRTAQRLSINEKGTTERVAKAGVTGAVTGATVHAGFGAVQKGVELVNQYKNGSVSVNQELNPTTDITSPKGSNSEQAMQVLDFQKAVEDSGKLFDQTKLKKIDPSMVSGLRKKIVENSGIDAVYIDKEDLTNLASDEKKAATIRNAIDPKALAAGSSNAPVKVPLHAFLDLRDEMPTISDYAKLHPEGPNPNTAKVHSEKLQVAEAQRAEVRKELAVGDTSLEEQAKNIKLNPTVEDATIEQVLASKERADAYLKRLDLNAEAEKNNPEQLAHIEEMKKRVSAIKENLPDANTRKATLEQALNTPFPENDVFNEQDYLNQPTFTKAVEGVLPASEVEKFNSKIREHKQAVVDNINETAKYEQNKVIDIVEKNAREAQMEIELKNLEDSLFLKLVDRFHDPNADLLPNERFPNKEAVIAPHHKEGNSQFAIDPRSLSEEQKAKYLNNEQLKKHGVFKKGGLTPDDSAALIGVNGGESLLKILSETPSRKDIAETRAAMYEPSIRQKAAESTDLNHTALANAYHAKTANELEVAKTMRELDWATTKKGIKRIALPLPRVEELTMKANDAVEKTKVGDLNENQFKVGQRKSLRIAVDSELKGDYEKARVAKEAEALNTELTLATHVAIGETNKVITLAEKFKSPKTIEMLKNASKVSGTDYLGAANRILDVYNLDPSKKFQSEQEQYQKFVDDQVKAGNANFDMKELDGDVRKSMNDMTIEEVKAAGDALRSILYRAKQENTFYNLFGPEAEKADALNQLADQIHANALEHPDYDINKSTNSGTTNMSFRETIVKAFSDASSMLKGMEHILLNADNGKVGGLLNSTVMAVLKGVGKFKGQGEEGKHQDAILLAKHIEGIIEKFGKKEWSNLKNDKLFIEEFKDNPLLKYGNVNKWMLFKMMLNMGNEGNTTRLEKGLTKLDGKGNVLASTDIDTIRGVLEKHLDEKHAIAAQEIWDTYKSYFPRVIKLHEETTGVTPEMVDAVPYNHKGKVYDGGYYPLVSESEMSVDTIRKSTKQSLEAMQGKDKTYLRPDGFNADDMTKHSHTEKRTNSSMPVDLHGGIGLPFDMLLHDLNFRKPIADALKIVNHPTISQDIANTVGTSDYNVIVNTIVKAARSTEAENTALFDSSKIFDMLEAKARSGVSAGYLIGNLSSIFIQPASMVHAVGRMGPSGAKHLLNTLTQMASHPTMILGEKDSFYAAAGEIHPAIRDVIQGWDENRKDPLREMEPNKNINKLTKGLDTLSRKVNEGGYHALGQADQVQKVIVSLSAYSQFIHGDAEGHSYETVMKMTPEERDHAAKVYASSVARLTLTSGSALDRAPIQQDGRYKFATMFFNDARNSLNNTFRQAREIRQDWNQGNYGDAATGAVGALTTMALIRGYTDIVRGYDTPWSSQGSAQTNKKFKRFDEKAMFNDHFSRNLLQYLATSVPDVIFGDTPFFRNINYAYQTEPMWKSKDVSDIQSKIATDVKSTFEVAMNFMDFINHKKKFSEKDAKAIAFTASYLSPRGLPVNAAFKIYDKLKEMKAGKLFTPALADQYKEKFEQFKKDHASDVTKDEMKTLEQIGAIAEPPNKSGSLDKQKSEVKD